MGHGVFKTCGRKLWTNIKLWHLQILWRFCGWFQNQARAPPMLSNIASYEFRNLNPYTFIARALSFDKNFATFETIFSSVKNGRRFRPSDVPPRLKPFRFHFFPRSSCSSAAAFLRLCRTLAVMGSAQKGSLLIEIYIQAIPYKGKRGPSLVLKPPCWAR